MDPSTPKSPFRFGSEVWIALALCLANLATLGYYLGHESLGPDTLHVGRLIVGILVMAGAGAVLLRGAIGGLLRGLQLSLFSILLLFAALQVHFQLFPRSWPQNIQNMMTVEDTAKLRRRIIEYLPHSPYAKPLPNISFTIPGFYSPSSDFDYEFVSDRRGFKNLRELDGRDQYDVVAVGDSFTEGLGVHARDTFVSRLNRKGISAYSIGIQGYAPTQMAGAFKYFGMALRPKVVVVGYLGNVYGREIFFLTNQKDLQEVAAPPEAIGRLIERDRISVPTVYFETKEGYRLPTTVKKQYRFLPTAFLGLADQYRAFTKIDIKAGVRDAAKDIRFGIPKKLEADAQFKLPQLTLYRFHVMSSPERRRPVNELADDPAWHSTLASFSQIIQDARSIDAKVIVMMLHDRGGVYYEAGTGNPLPEDYSERSEARLLREFSEREGVDFLDTRQTFEDQVKRMQPGSPFSDLPYLKIDGHPSPMGHELLAVLLQRYIEEKGYLRERQTRAAPVP